MGVTDLSSLFNYHFYFIKKILNINFFNCLKGNSGSGSMLMMGNGRDGGMMEIPAQQSRNNTPIFFFFSFTFYYIFLR